MGLLGQYWTGDVAWRCYRDFACNVSEYIWLARKCTRTYVAGNVGLLYAWSEESIHSPFSMPSSAKALAHSKLFRSYFYSGEACGGEGVPTYDVVQPIGEKVTLTIRERVRGWRLTRCCRPPKFTRGMIEKSRIIVRLPCARAARQPTSYRWRRCTGVCDQLSLFRNSRN